jgi:hypothetical protein
MAFRRIKNLYHTLLKGILDRPVLVPPYRVDIKTFIANPALLFPVSPIELQSS